MLHANPDICTVSIHLVLFVIFFFICDNEILPVNLSTSVNTTLAPVSSAA